MVQTINLIPQSEKAEQNTEKIIKLSTIFSIVLAVLVSILAAYLYYTNHKTKQNLKAEETTIETLRNQITQASTIEISARTLEALSTNLSNIMSSKLYFSKVLVEMQKRIPTDIVIQSFTMSPTKPDLVTLAGTGDNYLSIAKFTNSLSSQDFPGVDQTLKNLFTSVTLNSVSLEEKHNRANFTINVSYDLNLLKNN